MLNFLKDIMAPANNTRSTKNSESNCELLKKTTTIATPTAATTTTNKESIIKGFKITDNKRTKKYGIGAKSLEVLKEKAKLKFPINDLHVYLSSDGSEISDEDYFQSLEAQQLLIIAGPDEIITTDADFEYEKLRENSPLLKVSDIIYDFIEKHPDKFRKMIMEYEKRCGNGFKNKKCSTEAIESKKALSSLRSEHSEWFADERGQTKEEAMERRAQDRMRSYYYKTKDELTHNKLYRQNARARQIIDSVLEKFRYLLIGCNYFSMIFDRKFPKKHSYVESKLSDELDDETDAQQQYPSKRLKQVIKEYTTRHEILDEWSVSLCTDLGDFYCQGAYSDNGNCCSLKHTINPYASRENLILFQVWNLDHQIELSRSILPALLENVRLLAENPQKKCEIHRKQNVIDISVLEYFLEIFSLKNLKLVHIVCHEKSQRTNRSNGRLICVQCHEYKIVEELMHCTIPESSSVDGGDFNC